MDGTRKFKRSAKDEKTQHPPKRKKLDAITQPSIRQHDLRGASSSNRSGKVGDFATLERQRAQSSRRSDVAPSGPEIVPVDPSIKPKTLEAFTKMNRLIELTNVEFKEAHTEHLTKSKQAILEVAQVALDRVPPGQFKKALLLGIGHSFDIPLKELTERFDHVTVVELDRESAENAIRKLPPELQKKVELVVEDLTGVADEYSHRAQISLGTSKSLSVFQRSLINIANEIAEKVPEGPPDVGNDYTFVCSQLVLSQLVAIPSLYLENAAKDKFGSSKSCSRYYGSESYKKLRGNLQQEHIRYLARSVAPSGTVHFADTYSVQYFSPTESEPKESTMVHSHVIEPVLDESFKHVRVPTDWVFELAPQRQKFMVKSHCLEVRPSEPEQPRAKTPLEIANEIEQILGETKSSSKLRYGLRNRNVHQF